jgi:DNA-binding MarR family transcriptional regulator
VRLSIVAALSRVDKADFRSLRDLVEVSDSALSKQLTHLEAAGYVEISKVRAGRHARTWVALSPAGSGALRGHLAALRAIAELDLPPGDETP